MATPGPKLRRAWSLEEEASLIDLYVAGTPFEAIARDLDRSVVAVRSRASELRKEGKLADRRRAAPPSDIDAARKRVADLWSRGKSYREIAAAVDIEVSTVGVWLHAMRCSGRDVPRRKPAAWSGAELSRARKLAASGLPVAEIAERLGRPESSVGSRLADVSPSTRANAWSEEDDSRLAARYRDGLTLDALAAELGRSSSAVFARVQRLRAEGADLPPRRPRWTPEERAQLWKRRAEGATYLQLAREFGRAKGTISTQLRAIRLEHDAVLSTDEPH